MNLKPTFSPFLLFESEKSKNHHHYLVSKLLNNYLI